MAGKENCVEKGCTTDSNGRGSQRPTKSEGKPVPTKEMDHQDDGPDAVACRKNKILWSKVGIDHTEGTHTPSHDTSIGGYAFCKCGPHSS